jgi:predicted regulator of Ras-like GTPase activity (Roadblock/LC7/MglB family)
MVSKAAVIRQAILLSATISVFPLIVYPATFGIPAFSLHPLHAFAEWGVYFLVYLALRVSIPVRRIFMAAGVTVLFRIGIGLVLAVLVWLMHEVPLDKAVPQCLWEYPPAFILHIAFSPFVLLPLFNRTWARGVRFSIGAGKRRVAAPSAVGFSFAGQASAPSSTRSVSENDDVSFDAACSWVGEYSGVRMSIVVDDDGLVVAQWTRQSYSQGAEFWAPMVIEMIRFHRRWPPADESIDLRRLELETASGRLLVRRVAPFWLVVQTEADAGELVQVRIAQAVEMIEKYYHDRYRTVSPAGLEVSHV